MKNFIKDKINIFMLLFCFIISLSFLFICTKSSPLYAFNDWEDPNSFFTMGKGMANGLVPYKDLFEQKGPVLYLIHALAYTISNTSFLGVFICEVVSFTAFLFFCYKIIDLYSKKIHILWGLPLISFIVLSNFVFAPGDSAEEFCLPFSAFSLYYLLNFFKNKYPAGMSKKQLIANGAIAGIVLWTKYTLLGFWIGFIFSVFFGLVLNKKIKEGIMSCIYFLIGMAISTIPWIFYFVFTAGLKDMIEVYFLVNITAYSINYSILYRIAMAFVHAVAYAKNLILYSTCTFVGYIFFIKSKRMCSKLYCKIAFSITVAITIIGIYYGSNYRYYFLFLMPFSILGIIYIASLLEKIKKVKLDKIIYSFSICSIILLLLFCYITSPNSGATKTKKEDLVQYQFAEIINTREKATLLNYGFLDGGFYTIANIIPNIKYFSSTNVPYENYPIILHEQNRYIKEKKVDFVVIKVASEEESYNIPYLYENYNLIKSVNTFEEETMRYMLFSTKD